MDCGCDERHSVIERLLIKWVKRIIVQRNITHEYRL